MGSLLLQGLRCTHLVVEGASFFLPGVSRKLAPEWLNQPLFFSMVCPENSPP